jgi:D-xylose transport system ATP-binding protein
MRSVSKSFGGVHAVWRADFRLEAGEVVGLLGHNGAGKSTLVALLSGALALDEGEIAVDGRPVRIASPRDARALGIEALYQDLALADNLPAPANLFLGRELRTRFGLLDEAGMERITRDVVQRVNPAFRDFKSPVKRLSGGERQSIALARAVHFQARLLILDEPTAALGPAETRQVGALVRRLRDQGLGIVIVSHDLHDVFSLSDRVVVMKGGRVVASRATCDVTPETLLELIIAGPAPESPAGETPASPGKPASPGEPASPESS